MNEMKQEEENWNLALINQERRNAVCDCIKIKINYKVRKNSFLGSFRASTACLSINEDLWSDDDDEKKSKKRRKKIMNHSILD